jgi:hypothetical protein
MFPIFPEFIVFFSSSRQYYQFPKLFTQAWMLAVPGFISTGNYNPGTNVETTLAPNNVCSYCFFLKALQNMLIYSVCIISKVLTL